MVALRLPRVAFIRVAIVAITVNAVSIESTGHAADSQVRIIRINDLEDKIRGGMLAQTLGNLNGLPHEFKYIDEPGAVESYFPSLPAGAFTDDDTDIEWVYVHEMSQSGIVELPADRIAALWKRHINRNVYCANLYARRLMDLELTPPWTGNVALNPWSEFNISGQFLCESFGLMAPAMPQTAGKLGLRYTHVAIDGEPAQTTQLFTAMISLAFVENDVDRLLDAGLDAIDPQSRVAEVVRAVRKICAAHPQDWRASRLAIKERWQTHGGTMRDRNGYELNTACTVAALIYGRTDLVETLRIAFNLGWDCDNNAATAGTIVGAMKGRRWMDAQGWKIEDVYRNTTRDAMPADETLTRFEDKLIACARMVIASRGGAVSDGGVYEIRSEKSANVEPLATSERQIERLRAEFMPALSQELTETGVARARAAYVAICLGERAQFERDSPEVWAAAIAELQRHPELLQGLWELPSPQGDALRQAARQAGLEPAN